MKFSFIFPFINCGLILDFFHFFYFENAWFLYLNSRLFLQGKTFKRRRISKKWETCPRAWPQPWSKCTWRPSWNLSFIQNLSVGSPRWKSFLLSCLRVWSTLHKSYPTSSVWPPIRRRAFHTLPIVTFRSAFFSWLFMYCTIGPFFLIIWVLYNHYSCFWKILSEKNLRQMSTLGSNM